MPEYSLRTFHNDIGKKSKLILQIEKLNNFLQFADSQNILYKHYFCKLIAWNSHEQTHAILC